jgi:hypothetical protein
MSLGVRTTREYYESVTSVAVSLVDSIVPIS